MIKHILDIDYLEFSYQQKPDRINDHLLLGDKMSEKKLNDEDCNDKETAIIPKTPNFLDELSAPIRASSTAKTSSAEFFDIVDDKKLYLDAVCGNLTGVVNSTYSTKWPKGYCMNPETGLSQIIEQRDGEKKVEKISDYFEIVAETRDEYGESWGLLLRWTDRDKRTHEWVVPRSLLHARDNSLAEKFEERGLRVEVNKSRNLSLFISGAEVRDKLCSISKSGWHSSGIFATHNRIIGNNANKFIWNGNNINNLSESGSIDEWSDKIGKLSMGNNLLMTSISCAFAGPLLDITRMSGFGIHIYGDSQSGKTTCAAVAASVWGDPGPDGGILRSWRATSNGLEGVASAANDAFLGLDEIGQSDADEATAVVYMMANGAGKSRANRIGEARIMKKWKLVFISTGEISLSRCAASGAKRDAQTYAGHDVRLIHLPADVGAGMGAFEKIHGLSGSGVFSETISACASENFGLASRHFLAWLTSERVERGDVLRKKIEQQMDNFLLNYITAGEMASPQARSVARRLALVGVAGELAVEAGVLPWNPGDAMRAAAWAYGAWMIDRGGSESGEEIRAIRQVRSFIEMHGESRFTPIGTNNFVRTSNRVGWSRQYDGITEYLIMPEVWKSEICKNLNPMFVAKALIKHGFLINVSNNVATTRVSVSENLRARVYRVTSRILEK